MARLSGLQKEVLSLYRLCLRETRKKPEVMTHPFPSAKNSPGNYLHWTSRLPGNILRLLQGPSSTRTWPLRSVISPPSSSC